MEIPQDVSPPRPLSQSGKHPSVNVLNLLRDQFSFETWMLFGAAIQCSATYFLPSQHKRLAILPVIALATWKVLSLVSSLITYRPGVSDDAYIGKRIPSLAKDAQSDGGICVLLLGFRVNHPLGLMAPGCELMRQLYDEIMKDMHDNAETYGHLGSNCYLGTADSTTSNEILTTIYFKDHDGVEAFAYAPVHKDAWTRWDKLAKVYPHIGLMHESYTIPPGHWESVYINYKPSGLAATMFKVSDSEGSIRWATPVDSKQSDALKTARSLETAKIAGGKDSVLEDS